MADYTVYTDLKVTGGIKVGDKAIYPVLTGTAAPTTATKGAVGQFYCDTTNNDLYICTVAAATHTWKKVADLT